MVQAGVGSTPLRDDGRSRGCVTVIDGHEAIREAVCWWCAHADPPIAVGGSYATGKEMLEREPGSPAAGDVVVMELDSTDGQPSFATLARLVHAGFQIVIYSQFIDYGTALAALEIGAASYVAKAEGNHHLIAAIRRASTMRPYASPLITAALHSGAVGGRPRLGSREREILIAWLRYDSKQMVGDRLQISSSTVQTHLERIRAKYAAVGRAAPTKAALLARAIQDGILTVEDL